MNVNIKKSAAELALEAQVEALLENASGGQAQALESLRQNGMPHRKLEPWVYTDLRNLVRDTYRPATKVDRGTGEFKIDPVLAELGTCKIVRVNGFLMDDLSDLDALPDGVSLKVQDIATGVEADAHHFIADMVTAFASNSMVLEVAPGANVEQPILLANFTSGVSPIAAYAHTIIKMGEGASATIIESLEGEGDYQSSSLLDVSLGEKANLDFIRWQNEDVAATHLALTRLTLGGTSKWRASP
ncbi:MAG: SufD family Fe-S cluster assembly protein [Rhizobiales bacterium]|nr:SufD family Fe-S cluster assembly protein [Hyphomicrobiales bacterium]